MEDHRLLLTQFIGMEVLLVALHPEISSYQLKPLSLSSQ